MRVRCIRHVPFEGPGSVATWARLRGHTFDETLASAEEPPSPDAFEMLVILGGPMGADDDAEHPWLTPEKDLIARAVAEGRLVLGICLGAQIIASALGGRVYSNPEPEIGWFPVSMTDAGRRTDVFAGWPETFMAGHWHGDTFEPPPGAAVAAVSAACMRQAFAMDGGRVVGLQFHLEWNEHVLGSLIAACGTDLVPGRFVQATDRITRHPELVASGHKLLFELLDRMEALS